MMTNAAMRAGFSGGLVVDYPHRCFQTNQSRQTALVGAAESSAG